MRPKPPCVVGYEVAGTIAAVGDGVDAGRVGERVMAGTAFGGYASQVVVPQADAVALPERLSFEEGAAVPVVYATAWASLYGYGSLRAGERVLVHAAAGGVGIAALQLAKRGGAEVHGTASPGKHDRLRELGLDRASTTAATAGGATYRATTSSSTASAAPRSSAPTRCCAPAGASSRSAPRRSRRARRATCAARCPRRCG